ncbi:leucyl/phenylalanyl-tRNA--protein transferase [Endobacter medicaginis]|uniref:Leucyl/phenylalanyl-tRNA--protein transferase n=1 Tax=Endobacter medicaginis TaxID=1181271 RepID=A0A850NSH9_9PROT|nr:leucyl/phenylalanyl-tRNA--protein transferase [Endobacter medicaginis]MBB3173266.1 leucyl/phenylalanyl-tRNA--protein transferase [Endobacter medicaginis]MCX5476378.1 leucyl/phenylalanyl-tRNA--protein transferase [Endobacter medicaginis]NVN31854.1 leucyl/phenylalanyl-tRNA--protein transferase [Endobacter medicaginis]
MAEQRGSLDPALLLTGYRRGIFPMAASRHDSEVSWFAPPLRGILPLDGFHLPRRLRRTVLSGRFEIAADVDFAAVIAACAGARRDADDTWINPAIETAMVSLHRAGWAHSVECRVDGRLAGGLYGVAMGRAFFGESMFSHVTDASKVALAALVAHLRLCGFTLLDTQFLTAHLARFGAVEIERAAYMARLDRAAADVTHRCFASLDAAAIRREIAAMRVARDP